MAKIDDGAGSRRSGKPTGHEALRRLASIAIEHDHHKALARYLSEGLDPEAMCYEGGRNKGKTLIEAASRNDSLECFLVLRAAGAAISWEATQYFFFPWVGDREPDDQRRILSHLLGSGELDPDGEVFPGYGELTCYVYSGDDPVSTHAVLAEKARRESSEIMSSLGSIGAPLSKSRQTL